MRRAETKGGRHGCVQHPGLSISDLRKEQTVRRQTMRFRRKTAEKGREKGKEKSKEGQPKNQGRRKGAGEVREGEILGFGIWEGEKKKQQVGRACLTTWRRARS